MKPKITKEDEALLFQRDWKAEPISSPWCWVEPETKARYRIQDAVDLVKSVKSKKDE